MDSVKKLFSDIEFSQLSISEKVLLFLIFGAYCEYYHYWQYWNKWKIRTIPYLMIYLQQYIKKKINQYNILEKQKY